MTDPFGVLRAPAARTDPDPAFAARLRVRIERALALPRGVAPVTETETETLTPTGAAVPYLAVADARRALDWYADVFGAVVVGEPIVMPDGRVGHAELALAGGTLYLADEHPEIGVAAPRPGEASVSLMLAVDDADARRERAMAAGATGDREPYDGYGMRNAWIVDPFGHRWGLQSPLPSRTPSYRHGDVVYVSVWTPDPRRAAAFYGSVLGWQVLDDQVATATPRVGIWTAPVPTLFCCYAVDDLDAARDRVIAVGGTAEAERAEGYGRRADCVDDQGVAFALWEIVPGDGERPPPNGRRVGDLSYLTLEVVDVERAAAFYGAVLGWPTLPGSIPLGRQVGGTTPMIGLSGGHAAATAVPMWRVDDIAAGVERVRAAGGTATDPQQQPYGITSECTDDQGSRFYLGEL